MLAHCKNENLAYFKAFILFFYFTLYKVEKITSGFCTVLCHMASIALDLSKLMTTKQPRDTATAVYAIKSGLCLRI